MHFVIFSYGQAVDGLMGVSLDFQLMYRNMKGKGNRNQNLPEAKQLITLTLMRFRAQTSHVGLKEASKLVLIAAHDTLAQMVMNMSLFVAPWPLTYRSLLTVLSQRRCFPRAMSCQHGYMQGERKSVPGRPFHFK